MKKRKAKIIASAVGRVRERKKIIKDPKKRGEWVESVFMARARELGLAVSKPWGDSDSFDFVVGRPTRFVGVQVKSTTCRSGGGYECCIKGRQGEAYRPGSFDYLAAYVVLEDVWYIIPADRVAGRETVCLLSKSKYARYEDYREAWHLLREASAACEGATEHEAQSSEGSAQVEAGGSSLTGQPPSLPAGVLGRMQAAGNYFKKHLEQGSSGPGKESDEG